MPELKGVCRITVDAEDIFHEVEATLSLETETKERETKDTTGTEYRAGKLSWSASGNGLGVEATDASEHTFDALFVKWKAKAEVAVEFIPNAVGKNYYFGQALITNLEMNSAVNEDVTVTWSLQGTGDIQSGTTS